MASFSKSVLSYSDVHQIFEAAGKNGGVSLEFETTQKATVWASRANAYRVLLRKQNSALGRDFTCQFDHLMVRRAQGSTTVLVEPRGFDFKATLLDGTPIDLDKITLPDPVILPHEAASDDDLDAFFKDLEGKKK